MASLRTLARRTSLATVGVGLATGGAGIAFLDARRRYQKFMLPFMARMDAGQAMLFSDELEQRLEGVDRILKLADDHPAERQRCIDNLLVTIKSPDGAKPGQPEVTAKILAATRERLLPGAKNSWSALRIELAGAYLPGGVDLSGIELDGGHLHCYRASFIDGDVDLTGARINRSLLDFDQALFRNSNLLLPQLGEAVELRREAPIDDFGPA